MARQAATRRVRSWTTDNGQRIHRRAALYAAPIPAANPPADTRERRDDLRPAISRAVVSEIHSRSPAYR